MAVVAVAIVLSFHLKHQPSELERRMARPLGAIFWVLALSCLLLGVGNYISASCLVLSSLLVSVSVCISGSDCHDTYHQSHTIMNITER